MNSINNIKQPELHHVRSVNDNNYILGTTKPDSSVSPVISVATTFPIISDCVCRTTRPACTEHREHSASNTPDTQELLT